MLIYLVGDQVGYFAGKTITLGGNTYTSAELLSEAYNEEVGATAFQWLAKEMLVDGTSYAVSVT